MISSKQMYSKYFKEYRLSNEELKKLQTTLLSILLDVDRVCKKYEIDYMLSGGTALGAVRNQGFIPWDDDIDIMMTRCNYQKLISIFDRELSEKYYLVKPLSEGYFFKQPKIFLKNSVYTEIPFAGSNKYNMVFIDVFIIEYLPNSNFKRKIESKVFDFAYKAASLCVDYLYPSPPILEKCKTEEEVKKYYTFRRRLGHVFSIFGGMKFYLKLIDKISKKNEESNFMSVPSAISYSREIMPAESYLNMIDVRFEGHTFNIPKDYEAYFVNLYGESFMTPPPEDKRDIHVAYEMRL